ncbi:hypothetical protein QTP70_029210 [Hemibagrus guttatus]|uniref:Uncharacterized protein n=1 Tax=Hemibagrus guttatus TaxID=175788 RepID=A0AAE0UKV6_9TELE|nr:hypothetical protein QTP70_029210 [Hemibagrus guttatus]
MNVIIRKLTLNKPDSIEELKAQLKDELSLQYNFNLQYEEPAFNNALCNLTERTDLPERATLKLIPLVTLQVSALSLSTTESDSEILSPAETSASLKKQQWPEFSQLILLRLCKAYPDEEDFSTVAKALIIKHLCLGPQPGWYGWKKSLKFKTANYRTKLPKAGCEEVALNGVKRSKGNPYREPSSKNIKRPKRGEA